MFNKRQQIFIKDINDLFNPTEFEYSLDFDDNGVNVIVNIIIDGNNKKFLVELDKETEKIEKINLVISSIQYYYYKETGKVLNTANIKKDFECSIKYVFEKIYNSVIKYADDNGYCINISVIHNVMKFHIWINNNNNIENKYFDEKICTPMAFMIDFMIEKLKKRIDQQILLLRKRVEKFQQNLAKTTLQNLIGEANIGVHKVVWKNNFVIVDDLYKAPDNDVYLKPQIIYDKNSHSFGIKDGYYTSASNYFFKNINNIKFTGKYQTVRGYTEFLNYLRSQADWFSSRNGMKKDITFKFSFENGTSHYIGNMLIDDYIKEVESNTKNYKIFCMNKKKWIRYFKILNDIFCQNNISVINLSGPGIYIDNTKLCLSKDDKSIEVEIKKGGINSLKKQLLSAINEIN